MRPKDISKEDLLQSVKLLLETPDPHIHLNQQKLFTLFSIGFQYLLYLSTKVPGHYIIRVEDSHLLDKLIKKSKDDTTRRFMSRLALPRRLKYAESTLFLDFFHIGSWSTTGQLPKEKIKAALIVKNTVKNPMLELPEDGLEENSFEAAMASLPENYYLSSLQEFVPKTLTIAFNTPLEKVREIKFPFIKQEMGTLEGVRLSEHLNFEDDI